MKNVQRNTFKLNPIAAAIIVAMSAQLAPNVVQAGSGWGLTNKIQNPALTVPIQTYYANSPAGQVVALDPLTGLPSFDAVTTLPVTVDSGKALRKFVDTLPGFGPTKANNLGQYIPVAVPEKWVDLNGNNTGDDYYEIAAVEYAEQMHSDLPKATHLRGYVQLVTPGLAKLGVKGVSFTTLDGTVLQVVDNPHHLGPVINATTGTAVRVKFTNYLPSLGNLFLPVDKSLTGAGQTPYKDASGNPIYYTENRAEIHLVGGEAPWISAGSPHQWVAPAGETAAYAAGVGKGVSNKDVPDMAAAGPGSTTLYFPNGHSARFMFYQDRTSGLTRLNSYAGLEAGYVVTDPTEQALIASGAIPADQIPLIIEDKTFVPANVAQQDAKWDTTHWGQPGDLWFPHVYETNQDPNAVNGLNTVGRWDYGPWFWPIFAASAPLPTGVYGDASFVPESYEDTPVINGTAYPTVTIDPKAYRFRILNVSNDRFFNLGLYKADTTVQAPQLDQNGNPIFDASGNQLFFTNTEVKMLPAVADVTGAPLSPPVGLTATPAGTLVSSSYPTYDPGCLCQYPALPQLLTYGFSGPTRAWPIDARIGGAPDPASVGPDFIAIGTDGGFLPNPVDIPSQPVTYESNRRSVTVTNVYGYGLLVGPSERADVVVDFTPYAGQTLIVYNDAPTPFPFDDQRVDYFTGVGDQTASGGTYDTKPGYGPNTRTIMQIKVNLTNTSGTGGPLNVTALTAGLQAAYKASQPAPIVPESVYNTALGTTATDLYAHVATGSVAQPTLDFTTGGSSLTVTGINLISSGGQLIVGTTNIVGNAVPGSGTGYDPLNPPTVVFGAAGVEPCLPATGTPAQATATVDAASHQVTAIAVTNPGAGYVCAPQITFSSTVGVGAQAAAVMSSGTQSILVQTKAEQELFDNAGRYNSTGGVELPLTSGTTQTTVPLNYTDSPTEFIGDSEVQIWKLVDNGFWSNSMHFDFSDVQLINRVGWDGTVKAPANNEVGWKDTLRLNPLEDVVVAIRAKHPQVPFGLPASIRAQDPSIPLGAAASTNPKSSQLPFLADPGVTSPTVTDASGNIISGGASLLTTAVNTNVVVDNTSATSAPSTLGYDNEFTWATAVLGHSENDYIRPVVYHPTVTVPDAITNLADVLGNGTLSWTDPTPAATSLGNTKNEVGLKVLQAPVSADGKTVGAFNTVATLPANTTSSKIALGNFVYEVVSFNNAGTSAVSNQVSYAAPLAPTSLLAKLTTVTGAPANVTLTWIDNAFNETTYTVTRTGGTGGTVATTLPANSTSFVDTAVAEGNSYTYVVAAANAAGSASATTSINSPITVPLAPTNFTATASTAVDVAPATDAGMYIEQVTLNWTNNAFNDTSYNVLRNGVVIATLPADTTYNTPMSYVDTGTLDATAYTYQVVAINTAGSSSATASTTTPGIAIAAPTGFTATPRVSAAGVITVALSWIDNATNETAYRVDESVDGGPWAILPPVLTRTAAQTTATGGTVTHQRVPAIAGHVYSYRVAAENVAAKSDSAYATASASILAPAAPTAPTGLAATVNTTSGAVTLNWVAVTPATGTTIAYLVSINGGAPIVVNGNRFNPTAAQMPVGASYTVTVTTQATQYGLSTPSATAASTTVNLAVSAPTAPVLVEGTVTATTAPLSWAAVTGATSYVVQSSTNGGAWANISTITANARNPVTYNAALVAGSSYQFKVIAQTSLYGLPTVVSAASNIVTANTLPARSTGQVATAGAAGSKSIKVSWTNTSSNLTGWTITRTGTVGRTATTATIIPTITATGTNYTFTDTGLTTGTTYTYSIVAKSALGSGAAVTTAGVRAP